ncbi:MAG: RNA pseudouridine synthase, partial [Gammaproteobacteria bacterium]|nr:RNA pseudouridine synthase [Gammaproteobacteria bacterium]
SEELLSALRRFKRQALHAGKIGLIHPASAEPMEWDADAPEDMQKMLQVLKYDASLKADS